MPRRILAVAVEQWRTRNDTPFVRVLLAAGADLCQVDSVTEVAPIHKVRNKILEVFFAIPSARPSAYTIPHGPFREGGTLDASLRPDFPCPEKNLPYQQFSLKIRRKCFLLFSFTGFIEANWPMEIVKPTLSITRCGRARQDTAPPPSPISGVVLVPLTLHT